MYGNILKLLKILEEETDSDHSLSKVEIMERMELAGYESIGEKQFYRMIDELEQQGYIPDVKKGRATRYNLHRCRMTTNEWMFLMTLILGNEDLTESETRHIVDCLENMHISRHSMDSFTPYKKVAAAEKSPVSHLSNLRVVLDAIAEGRQITCKILQRGGEAPEISDLKTLTPRRVEPKGGRIDVVAAENGTEMRYPLSVVLDAEIL